MLRANFPHRREQRQEAAKKRQAQIAPLTVKQRLTRLDLLGEPATKERAKLAKRDAEEAATLKKIAETAPIAHETLFPEPAEPGQSPKAGKQKRKDRQNKRGAK